MVGGHLDSWDLGTGAHDNAAGVAITMAAAKLAGNSARAPRRGIRVVLFANEEQGIYGGKAYAAQHADATAAACHRCGVGSWRRACLCRFAAGLRRGQCRRGWSIDAMACATGVPYQPDRPATGGADLGQMRRLGMPMIDLNLDASDYFDYHHNANDTLDKIDPESLAFNVAAFATFIYWASRAKRISGRFRPRNGLKVESHTGHV